MSQIQFPFTAISGQDDFKLCLILCMIDPTIGGVLASGDKGTGKTTTVRGIRSLMNLEDPHFNFVNLPLGATEDRVLGGIELEVLINEKKTQVRKGLLGTADNGILYIDEVNLLNDYLMDMLLDAASSGGYYLERDGVSSWQESKFCLVGTMNKEEGMLRPQLLDRFGLGVSISTCVDRNTREEIIRKRIAFDENPKAFKQQYLASETTLCRQIFSARAMLSSIVLPEYVFTEIASTCIELQVEGHRADILLMKAARALAAFQKDSEVSTTHLEMVMPFVTMHRSRNKNSSTNSRKKK